VAAAATSFPASTQVAPVPPVTPAKPEDEGDEGGPSTAATLFWMVVTGIVVVGLVLAFLHFLTGVFR